MLKQGVNSRVSGISHLYWAHGVLSVAMATQVSFMLLESCKLK